MSTEPLVSIDKKKCNNCFSCIRVCPVKAIQTKSTAAYPTIVNERCIGCGACIETCGPKAIDYRSSLEIVKAILKAKGKKAVIVAPSISSEFEDITDYRKFVEMIKSLGANYVLEVSFGVDLIAHKYLQFFSNFKGRYYITSCDPVVVSFIEKYHPNLINNLAPFVSPPIAAAKVVRKKYGDNIKLIYIGPDIAYKDEVLKFDDDGRIDAVLTFGELRKLFKEFNIDENLVEYSEFDPPIGYKGSLYPIPNGLLQAADIDENLLTTNVITASGRRQMIESIEEFESNVKVINRHLHVTYGNALKGPGITSKGNKLLKEHLVIKYANKRLMNFFRSEWYDNLEKYLQLDFTRKFTPNDQRLPKPDEKKIREALSILGVDENVHTDCSQCGYSSCKEFATNMAQGIIIPEMCATFAIRNSKYFSDTLKELNEKLAKTRSELRETEAMVRTEHDSAQQASDLTNAMLEKLRAGIVIVDYKLKIVKANTTFSTILGEEAEEINEVIPGLIGADLKKLFPDEICNLFSYVITNSESIDGRDVRYTDKLLNLSIFPIRENQIAGAIVRDMQAPEVQKAEVISRVSEVIDKNLEMVQKIGFLLGESASDIEKMLNSVIEFYQNDSLNK